MLNILENLAINKVISSIIMSKKPKKWKEKN